MSIGRTAHVDTFVRDRLPPPALLPQLDLSSVPDLAGLDTLNAASLLLDEWIARGHGGQPALHHDAGQWTYQRVFDTANRIAHVLVDECGLVPGGRVLLRAGNHPWLVAAWFGVLKAGGITVTTAPLLRARELKDIIEQARVSLALCDEALASDLQAALAGRTDACVVWFGASKSMGGGNSLETLIASKPAMFPTRPTAADDPAIVAFTSGTTGRSKGTVHTHRDLIATTDTYGRHVLPISQTDVCIGSPPLAFTFGLGGLVLFPFRVGASTALVEQTTPPALIEAIEQYRATIVFTSPTGYRAMLPHVGGRNLGSLRAGVSAGETLPAATFNAWLEATGIRLMDGIGSTEMLHIFIGSRAEDGRAGSTGMVVPGYHAKIVDDDGQDVPRGTIGRLAVYGPTGCRYLDDPVNQRKYVERGWNITGDAYRQDEDGYFWFESRTDDMIVSSGYNVSGVEVENVLLGHASVAECAVVGVPDEARGQLVKAFIVLAGTAAASDVLARDLQEHVKAELAPFKYPRAIEFVAALPRTVTGKLQRFQLRGGRAGAARKETAVQIHLPAGWPTPKGYANVVSATGRTVFVAGQVGWDPVTMAFTAKDFAGEVRQALTNIVTALAAAGARPDQITRLTWFITDKDAYLQNQKPIGQAYRDVIGRHYPAMSVIVVSALIEDGARVEIEATAVVETDGAS